MSPLSHKVGRALQTLSVPAYVIDRDGRFAWLNRGAVELVGDAVGRRFSVVVAPDQLNLARQEFARKLIGEAAETDYELDVVGPAGRVTVRIASVPLYDADRIVGVFGLAVPGDAAAAGPAPDRAAPTLTARQHEVLRLLGRGLGTEEIASRLGIADETVRNHIRALLRALGAHSRLEAVLTAARRGLLTLVD